VGFAAGDAATVRATVVDGARAAVRAIEVYGGTRAAYLHSATVGDRVPLAIGGGFGLLGVAMLVTGGLGVARVRRAAAEAGRVTPAA
jgi:hypothetical protein